MIYEIPFEDIATGAVADTYKGLLGLKVPNTAGLRFKLRGLFVGFSDDAPDDKNVAVQIKRVTTYAANGTGATQITAANIPKADPNARTCEIEAWRNYTTNPTTLDPEALFQGEINDRNGLFREWGPEDRDIPRALLNQMLVILAAPRAAQASRLSGTASIEVY